MKLNIGCGKSPMGGYVNIDIQPRSGVAVVASAVDLPFKDGEVEEVHSRMLFEHMRLEQGAEALTEWMRVLEPGGKLRIIAPDLVYHAKQLSEEGNSPCCRYKVTNVEHAMAGIYGAGGGTMQHCWGYTRCTLQEAVELAGFVQVGFRADALPCNIDLTAMKP